MVDFRVVFARSARKELSKLDRQHVERIFVTIESLGTDPRPSGCRKLVGSVDRWRIRIGDYRVIYTIDDRTRVIDIIHVRHRSDAYR